MVPQKVFSVLVPANGSRGIFIWEVAYETYGTAMATLEYNRHMIKNIHLIIRRF